MAAATFSPWRDNSARDCRTCVHAMGREDGVHIWCLRHRLVVVFPCGWWEREPGIEIPEPEAHRDNADRFIYPPG